MADATDTLKYAAAAALLMAGAAPAYYFIMYLPQKDALARQAVQDERDRKAEAEAAHRARYDSCIEQAMTDYTATWNINCATQHKDAVNTYNLCKKFGGSEAACAEPLKDAPEESCSLSLTLGDKLNKRLAERKELCLAEFKAG